MDEEDGEEDGRDYTNTRHSAPTWPSIPLPHQVSTSAVPKLTMVVGGSFGAGNYGMCSHGP